MSQKFGNYFPPKGASPGGPTPPKTTFGSHAPVRPGPLRPNATDRKPVYSKSFHWRLPDGQAERPATVEVVGTFTHWQKVPLTQNGDPNAWEVLLTNIPAHRTHHYMILVDGQPTHDPNNDGLAIPHGLDEVRYQITTPRGPRVFMMFGQTK